jgi:uncharacterized membrane-anchored protein
MQPNALPPHLDQRTASISVETTRQSAQVVNLRSYARQNATANTHSSIYDAGYNAGSASPLGAQKTGDDMANPTQELVDAKLAASEARTETRFVELNGKIDRIADLITGLRATVGSELGAVKVELAAVKADNKFSRTTIIVAVVGSVIAGLAALLVTQANLLAAFQAGISVKSEIPAVSNAPRP